MPDDTYFPDPDIDPATWDALIALLTAAYGAGIDDSAELVGMGKSSAAEYAASRGAELLGKRLVDGEWIDNPNQKWVVSDTIREQVRAKLVKAIEEGQSPGEFRASLEQELSDIDYRALMVARTETGFAYNSGALANYKDAEVTHVEVMDGGTEGSCEDCDALDGETWTIEEAEANPLEHPNCTRAFAPVLMEE
jgi:SPP1 gp7 family putative phage head morphogenesis protein